jgi:hypothetical protein
MAESVVSICNNALGSIGELPITSLADNSKAARACNQRWPSVRDAVLRAHEWACCSTDVSLSASSTTPTSPEWDYAYPLPADFLRIIRVSTTDAVVVDSWEIVGREILCNETAPIIVRYVRREEDPLKYDSLLVEAFTARLAYEICPVMEIVSASLIAQLREAYKENLREARGVNARDVQPRALTTSRWSAAKTGA